ncbi:MAG: peroxidase-related enzyme [Alphaproteobacteria bacterium]|nr:peroxidase-related enzyme [Alphaproteobacteria bacterium]MBL6776254.1 peroxidase-related enzyme [Alphaproteobacteria bacterium]
MTSPAISRFEVPEFKNLPEDIQSRMTEIQEKAGFIPNVFLALSYRPDELRAFMAYHDALILRDSGLSKAEKEMIIVATSAKNDCLYCAVAHGAILRIYAKDSKISDQIATDYTKADITDKQKAMLDFAIKTATNAAEISEADLKQLRAFGFSEDDIWDIGAITALFALSNRMASLAAMRPNDEFYTMGRNF